MAKELTTWNGNGGIVPTDRYEISDKWLNVASKGLDLLRFVVEADFQTSRMEHDRLMAKEQMKYDYLRQTDVSGRMMAERDEALSRAYAVLDKATESDDRELMKSALDVIGKIVSNGPHNKNDEKLLD
ncbi:MAG: hypothetical protein MJZ15_08660 [Bacteroidales bacterium]|nr:hypothetical protein [Bacteroidales bacterium]